jgi:hypothetical protein
MIYLILLYIYEHHQYAVSNYILKFKKLKYRFLGNIF